MTAEELLRELVTPCPACRGTGTVVDVEWRPHLAAGTIPPPGDPLRGKPVEMPCPTCEGKGSQLTDPGRLLIAIVRAHL